MRIRKYNNFINEMNDIPTEMGADELSYFNSNKSKLENLMMKSKDINDPNVKKSIQSIIKDNRFMSEWSNIVTSQINIQKIEDRLNFNQKYIADKNADISNSAQVQDSTEKQSQISSSKNDIQQKTKEMQQSKSDLNKMKVDVQKKISEFNNSIKDIAKK